MEFSNYQEAFIALRNTWRKGDINDGLVELVDVSFHIPHDIEYVDVMNEAGTAVVKACDREYIKEELAWYRDAIPNINANARVAATKIWKRVASPYGDVNSNYGYRILHSDNYCQFYYAIDALKKNKFSKQSVMYYAYPAIHKHKDDGIHARSDMICTTHVQMLIRDNKLNYYVFMRSNDAFYGFQNDYSWHRYVHESAFDILKDIYPDLKIGEIVWHATSFHVYERHFKLLEKI